MHWAAITTRTIRKPATFFANIFDESVYAEEVGLYSDLDRKLPCGRRAIDADAAHFRQQ